VLMPLIVVTFIPITVGGLDLDCHLPTHIAQSPGHVYST